jgi:TP901 family phage tail tape measure protein
MPAPVVVEFLLRGMPDMTRAFRTVEQAALAAGRAQTTAAQRETRARSTLADREARDKVRAMLKADQETRRIQDRAYRETERLSRQRTREAQNAAKAEERAAERAAAVKLRAEQNADREIRRLEKDRARENERILNEGRRLEERTHQEQLRRLRAEDKEHSKSRATFARAAFGGVASGGRAVMGGMSRVAGMVGQLGGGFDIMDSIMGEANLRKKASVISASTILSGAGKPGADASMGRAMSTDELVGKAKAIGIQQNTDPSDVLGAIDEIKKLTGNVEKATTVAASIAKLATATGGDVKEMSGLAANILAANPNISNKDLDSQMRIFTKQGVVGGVEVADMAKYGSRLTAGASMYGGSKEKNEATLGAMAQMARQYGSAGSAAEATLGSLRFSTDVAKHASTLKAGGIDVSDGKGNLRDAQSILLDMLKKTGGDVTKLAGLGLGDRGVKPLEGVANIFKNAGGGTKGEEAVKAEFAKYTTGVSAEEIDAANKRVLAEQEAEIQIKRLKQTVGEQLLPELQKLIPVLRDAMPTITSLVRSLTQLANWAAGHPFAAVGAALALSVSKSVAEAGLKSILEKSVATSLGAGGGLAVAGATIAITSAMIAIQALSEQHSAQVSKDINTSNAAVSEARSVRIGDQTTKDDVAVLAAKRDAMAADVARQRAGVNSKDAMEYVGMAGKVAAHVPLIYAGLRASGTDPDAQDSDMSAEYQRSREERLKQAEAGLKELNDALAVASANLKKLGADGVPGGGPAGKPPAASGGIVQRPK